MASPYPQESDLTLIRKLDALNAQARRRYEFDEGVSIHDVADELYPEAIGMRGFDPWRMLALLVAEGAHAQHYGDWG